MRGNPWTPDEVALLMQLIDVEKLPRAQVVDRLGRSFDSCSTKYHYEREKAYRRQLRAAANAETPFTPQPIPVRRRSARAWSEVEIAEVIRLREVERLTWAAIDARLDRPEGGSQGKYMTLRRPQMIAAGQSPASTGGQVRIAPSAAAAREEASRLMPASLTAAVFGDPLPGRSALDRRIAAKPFVTLPSAP